MADPQPIYFAWVDGPAPFNPLIHAVDADDQIIALKIAQEEGDFASLEIDIRNPGVGLLNPAREQWCMLSWYDGVDILPLFHGRLIAVMGNIDGEAGRLLFRAKVNNFEDQKHFIASNLKIFPYYDPVWISGDLGDDDSVLNAYASRWHIDRSTLDLSISDELEGEDGTLVFGEEDCIYDALEIEYAERPATSAKVKATLAWTQSGEGTINLSERIYELFHEKKSIYIAPGSGVISSLTGDGLVDDWPKGGTTFGGGWSVNVDTFIEYANEKIFAKYNLEITYQGLRSNYDPSTIFSASFFEAYVDWTAKFPVYGLHQETKFDWAADKKRAEILEFTMTADIQPLTELSEDEGDSVEITISASDTVTEPDDGGGLPIVDKRRNSYLPTLRGDISVQYIMLLARAELRRRSRAVEVKFRVPWSLGIIATLRHNAQIFDYRLPGGGAAGKIIAYEIVASGTGEWYVDITIGCPIGRGGTVTPDEGTGAYANPGYMNDGYQKLYGAQVLSATADLVWQNLNDFTVDDDGVDLLTLDEITAVDNISLTGGLADQVEAIFVAPDPVAELKLFPSVVTMELKPVAGLSFETIYTPTVVPLPIPQGINLEAS